MQYRIEQNTDREPVSTWFDEPPTELCATLNRNVPPARRGLYGIYDETGARHWGDEDL